MIANRKMNKYFVHIDQHCRFFFEEDGIIEEVYQLSESWLGKNTTEILEWIAAQGWRSELYILPPPMTTEEKEKFKKENSLENKNIIEEKRPKEDAPTENTEWCREHNQ